MKKYILGLFIIALSAGFASAQPKGQYYTLGWNIGIPLPALNDYVSTVSLNGASLQAHIFLTDNITVGAMFGWNTYYQETDRQTNQIKPGLMVTAAAYRYVNTTPMKVAGSYFFTSSKISRFQPYVSIGIGAAYMTEHSVVQDYDFWNSEWGFLAAPEIGTFIRFGQNFGANISAAYNISTNSFSYNQHKVNNAQSIVFNIGLSYMIR